MSTFKGHIIEATSVSGVLEALGQTAVPNLLATHLYVDSDPGVGSDSNDGSIASPYLTMEKAMGAVRGMRTQGEYHEVNVILAPSTDTGYGANPKVYPISAGDLDQANNVSIRCQQWMVIDGPFRATSTADTDWDGGLMMEVVADDTPAAYDPGWVPGNTWKSGSSSAVGLRGGYFVWGQDLGTPTITPSNMPLETNPAASDYLDVQWQAYNVAHAVVGATSSDTLRFCGKNIGYLNGTWNHNGVPYVPSNHRAAYGVTGAGPGFALSGADPAGNGYSYAGKNYLVRPAAKLDFHGATSGQIRFNIEVTRLTFYRLHIGVDYDAPVGDFLYWNAYGASAGFHFCFVGPVRYHNEGATGDTHHNTIIRLVGKSATDNSFTFNSSVIDCGHANFDHLKTKRGAELIWQGIGAIIDNPDPDGIRINSGGALRRQSGRDETPAIPMTDPFWDGSMVYLDNSYGPITPSGVATGVERGIWHGQLPVGGPDYLTVNKEADIEGFSPRDEVRQSDLVTPATLSVTYTRRYTELKGTVTLPNNAMSVLRWRIPAAGRLGGIFVVPEGAAVNVTSGAFTLDAWVGLSDAGTHGLSGAFTLHGLAGDTEAPVTTLTTTLADLEMDEGDYLYVEVDNIGGTVTGPTQILVTPLFYLY